MSCSRKVLPKLPAWTPSLTTTTPNLIGMNGLILRKSRKNGAEPGATSMSVDSRALSLISTSIVLLSLQALAEENPKQQDASPLSSFPTEAEFCFLVPAATNRWAVYQRRHPSLPIFWLAPGCGRSAGKLWLGPWPRGNRSCICSSTPSGRSCRQGFSERRNTTAYPNGSVLTL